MSSRGLLIIIAFLAVVLALTIGIMIGYMSSRGGQPSVVVAAPNAPGAVAPHGQDHGPCPFDPAPEQRAAFEGLRCNCPTCSSPLLLDCHCGHAHAIKAYGKELLAKGVAPEKLGAELEAKFGVGIIPPR